MQFLNTDLSLGIPSLGRSRAIVSQFDLVLFTGHCLPNRCCLHQCCDWRLQGIHPSAYQRGDGMSLRPPIYLHIRITFIMPSLIINMPSTKTRAFQYLAFCHYLLFNYKQVTYLSISGFLIAKESRMDINGRIRKEHPEQRSVICDKG